MALFDYMTLFDYMVLFDYMALFDYLTLFDYVFSAQSLIFVVRYHKNLLFLIDGIYCLTGGGRGPQFVSYSRGQESDGRTSVPTSTGSQLPGTNLIISSCFNNTVIPNLPCFSGESKNVR